LNARISGAADHPQVELSGALADSMAMDPPSFAYRSVRADGVFDSRPLLIRGRSLDGRPGVHLIVPFRLDAGELVLVNQGWLPSPDGATVDPRPYLLAGLQSLEAVVQPLPETGDDVRRSEIQLPGYTVPSFLRVDGRAAADELGERVMPVILQLTTRPTDAAELPVPLPPPELDEGPHLGYAIQWFSFSAIALVGALALAFRRFR
jgi:surfeit locus 1 family protein